MDIAVSWEVICSLGKALDELVGGIFGVSVIGVKVISDGEESEVVVGTLGRRVVGGGIGGGEDGGCGIGGGGGGEGLFRRVASIL